MKNILPILFSLTAIVLTTGNNEKAFPQTTQPANEMEVTETKNPELINETGYVTGITTARAIGLAELVLGILSIVFAIRAKKGTSLKSAKTALTLGLLAVVISLVHFITVSGAVFGSGSGKAGAILAFVLGQIGITISGWLLRRKAA